MTHVRVSAYSSKRTGKPVRKMLTWASFRIEGEAWDYAAKLRKDNPSWYVQVDHTYPKKSGFVPRDGQCVAGGTYEVNGAY